LQLEGVQNVISHVDYLKRLNSAYMEGNLKWMAVSRSKTALDNMVLMIPANVVHQHGKLTPMIIFLDDHKAQTLQRVVDAVEAFAAQSNTDTCHFLLAAGKVATLPVIAVGVGIGVDYGIYIFYKLLHYRDRGHALAPAFYRTLNTTGEAVTFTGLTRAVGVATSVFSPIKFQADMGFLLTFMFLWNMVGAMVLMPALARFLYPKNKY
jgi:hypothetical protein